MKLDAPRAFLVAHFDTTDGVKYLGSRIYSAPAGQITYAISFTRMALDVTCAYGTSYSEAYASLVKTLKHPLYGRPYEAFTPEDLE